MYIWIDSWIKNQESKGNTGVTVNDAIDVLESYEFSFDTKESQGLVNNEIIDFYNRVQSGLTSFDSEEGDEVVEITEGYINTLTDTASKESFDKIKKLLKDKIFKDLNSDKSLKALDNLEAVSFINNPILPIIKQISKKIRNSDINIEDVLEEIYQ
jgi:hypothetical protein